MASKLHWEPVLSEDEDEEIESGQIRSQYLRYAEGPPHFRLFPNLFQSAFPLLIVTIASIRDKKVARTKLIIRFAAVAFGSYLCGWFMHGSVKSIASAQWLGQTQTNGNQQEFASAGIPERKYKQLFGVHMIERC